MVAGLLATVLFPESSLDVPDIDRNWRLYAPLQPLVGDPNFSPDDLSPELRLWYDRLWTAIETDNPYPDPDDIAPRGDLYTLGRTLNAHITALLTAFRVTGDLAILDEIDRILEIARAQLADTNGDGYLNWRWLRVGEEDNGHYGKDVHDMDEMLTHTLVAAAAYAMYNNAGLKPVYDEHAAFWLDYLTNHFLAKWQERGGIEKSLTHPFAHFMRFHYYLYRMTGDQQYLDEAFRRATVLDNMMEERETDHGIAFVWDHRVPNMGEASLGCQPTVYGLLTIDAFQDLAREGFGKYADPAYMMRYTATFRDLVLKGNVEDMAGSICGTGSENFEKFLISGVPGLATWDETGELMDLTNQAYLHYENPNNTRRVFIPAYMLAVLSPANQNPVAPNLP